MPGLSWDSPGIIPGQSHESLVYVFSCFLMFFWPYCWCCKECRDSRGSPQSVESKGDYDHVLEILENFKPLNILELLWLKDLFCNDPCIRFRTIPLSSKWLHATILFSELIFWRLLLHVLIPSRIDSREMWQFLEKPSDYNYISEFQEEFILQKLHTYNYIC